MLCELLVMAEGPDRGKVSASQLSPGSWGDKEGPPQFERHRTAIPPGVDPKEYRWDFAAAQLVDHEGHPPRPKPPSTPPAQPARRNLGLGVDPAVTEKLATFCKSIEPYPAERFAGDGIVTCAGGATLQANAYVLFRLLRRLGCTLPIECFYDGLTERDASWERLVEPLGVQCRDARQLGFRGLPFQTPVAFNGRNPYRAGEVNGYALKPFSVLHSRFERLLYLDADNCPVRDPAFLLEGLDERDPVTLWEDIGSAVHLPGFGLAPIPGVTIESGQMAYNKRRAWRPMVLAEFFGQHATYFSRFSWGEKDFYIVACMWTETAYTVVRGCVRDPASAATVHPGPDGETLFCHRTAPAAKWQPHGPTMEVPGFPWHEECLAYLAEWRAWREAQPDAY